MTTGPRDVRKLLGRIAAWWHRGPIWGDRGPWDYTTRRAVTVTQGPVWPRVEKPTGKLEIDDKAREVCKRFGHTLHRGKCLVCRDQIELEGEWTVERVLSEK